MYEIQQRMPDGQWRPWLPNDWGVLATFTSPLAALHVLHHELTQSRTATLRIVTDAEANHDWPAVTEYEAEYRDVPYRVVRVAEKQVEATP